MKKILICLILLCVLMCSCGDCGNVDFAVRESVGSEIYHDREIEDAMDEAEAYFKKHFNWCIFFEITSSSSI